MVSHSLFNAAYLYNAFLFVFVILPLTSTLLLPMQCSSFPAAQHIREI